MSWNCSCVSSCTDITTFTEIQQHEEEEDGNPDTTADLDGFEAEVTPEMLSSVTCEAMDLLDYGSRPTQTSGRTMKRSQSAFTRAPSASQRNDNTFTAMYTRSDSAELLSLPRSTAVKLGLVPSQRSTSIKRAKAIAAMKRQYLFRPAGAPRST